MKNKLTRDVLFRIFGKTLDPSEVTILFGREPSYAHRTGERVDWSERPRSQGMWQISSERAVDSPDLEEHISWILDQVEPQSEVLKELTSRDGIQADLFCFWQQESNEGLAFNPVLLGRVAALGLELGIEIT